MSGVGFDLDHVRAHIAEDLCAIQPHDQTGEVAYFNSVECAGHIGFRKSFIGGHFGAVLAGPASWAGH